ncbi:MAG: hypothetical protein JNL91_07695 [Candidatus Accumulibacter sp.]|nr:hypothetical protein [Accumulibacter sp.]
MVESQVVGVCTKAHEHGIGAACEQEEKEQDAVDHQSGDGGWGIDAGYRSIAGHGSRSQSKDLS